MAGLLRRPDDRHVADLGANLRGARKKLSLTQEEVADASGVHATEVSRIEAGKRDPQVSTVRRLAESVNLTAEELLDGQPILRRRFDIWTE